MGACCCAPKLHAMDLATIFVSQGEHEGRPFDIRLVNEKTKQIVSSHMNLTQYTLLSDNRLLHIIPDLVKHMVIQYYWDPDSTLSFNGDIFVTECGHKRYVGHWRKGHEVYFGKRRTVWDGPEGGKIFWWNGSGQHPHPAWWIQEGGATYYVDSKNQKSPPGGATAHWKVFRGQGSLPNPILSSAPISE